MAISYSRNVDLALDADLTLMLRREAYRLVYVLERGAHRIVKLLKLAFVLKCEATQAHILMLKRDPEVCALKNSTTIAFDRDCKVHV